MEKMRPVSVICRFGEQGSIVPLKIKIEDEEQTAHTYTIKSYKEPSIYLEHREGYLGRPYQTQNILEFVCKIVVFDQEKIIKLRYYVPDMRWMILY